MICIYPIVCHIACCIYFIYHNYSTRSESIYDQVIWIFHPKFLTVNSWILLDLSDPKLFIVIFWMTFYSSCNFEHCVETAMSSKSWLHFWVKIPKFGNFRSNPSWKPQFQITKSKYVFSCAYKWNCMYFQAK